MTVLSDRTLTAVMAEILLHYYYSPADYPIRSDGDVRAIKDLVALGLLQVVPTVKEPAQPGWERLECSERGTVHVQAMLCLQLPVSKWVTP